MEAIGISPWIEDKSNCYGLYRTTMIIKFTDNEMQMISWKAVPSKICLFLQVQIPYMCIYVSQTWSSLCLPTEVSEPKSINTLSLWHFSRWHFKCIFLNENVWNSIKISLKFVPKVWVNNIPALVQIMAWCRSGNKPLSEPMMAWCTDACMWHSASMS